MEYVMAEMQKDGLINRAYQVRIIFTDSTIIVNNKNLAGSIYNKYKAIYKQAHPNCGNNFSNSLQCNTDQPFPPDNHRGMNISDQQRLNEISEELYRTGYQGYILADAVHDGYINDGEHFKIGYKRDGFFIEGVRLSEDVKKRYDKKMEAFIAKHKTAQLVWWSLEDSRQNW